MKAAITSQYGSPNVLRAVERPTPSPRPDEVLVRVEASPVTAGDRRLRAGDFPGVSALFGRLLIGLTGPRARVQGTMFAGRVVAVGSDVTAYAAGDRVFGGVDDGAYAEFLVIPEDGPMANIPEGVSFVEAAEIPYGAVTALRFLRDIARVQRGEKVVVVGAAGGVGRYAVQIAKDLGAEVWAVGSGGDADLMRDLGADHVIDYHTEDFTTDGRRYDVIFDIADAKSYRACLGSLAPRGRYLSLMLSLRILLTMLVTSLVGGRRAHFGVAMQTREDMVDVAELLARGALRAVVAEPVFTLDRIADAHAEADARRQRGTVMVRMAA